MKFVRLRYLVAVSALTMISLAACESTESTKVEVESTDTVMVTPPLTDTTLVDDTTREVKNPPPPK